jgi:hypothetical protein
LNKFAFAALAAVAALVLGFGARISAPTAHADTTGVSSVGCELLARSIDGVTTDATTGPDYAAACDGVDPTEVGLLGDALGDQDGVLEKSDLDDLDVLDGNQISEDCTGMGVQCTIVGFVFVDDEAAVTIDPPAGLVTDQAGDINWVCDTEGEDADCADTTPNDGDGVVTFDLYNDTAGAGDVKTVNVEQETVEQSFDVNVVGVAHDVTLALVETTIQSNGSTADASACQTENDVADASSITQSTTTVGAATVTDSDGTKLARVTVDIASGTTSAAVIGTGSDANEITGNTGQTVDGGAAGIASFFVICGGKSTGTSKITATINDGDPNEDKASETITVVGEPDSIALTASPAAIACDGTATSSVTAKVTDANGDDVADGVTVNFSVVALGIANPINAKTVAGSASSTITPLSGATAGVTVIVTSGDAQSSIRVDCSLPIPTPTSAAPAPTATPKGGTIGVSDTGNGGYMGQDGSASFPMWTLIALAMGSVALVGGSVVARRSGK